MASSSATSLVERTSVLGEGVEAYESGELTAEKLRERFARTRVKERSPSFS
jgi:hypothetical protein